MMGQGMAAPGGSLQPAPPLSQLSMLSCVTRQCPAVSCADAQLLRACRWSPTEKRELIRRRLLLLFYLLRSPFFDLYTRWGLRPVRILVRGLLVAP